MTKICVYTVLIGQYERLNEQPAAHQTDIPFICFTDNPHLTSDTWQIRVITPLFPADAVRSQRDIKIRVHAYLPEFDHSLYIDNTVLLTDKFQTLFRDYDENHGLAIPRHSFRDKLLMEFVEVAWIGMDSTERIWTQLNDYYNSYPEILTEQPYWTGMLIRSHRHPKVCRMQDIWAAHVCRYSRRDQLSINVALKDTDMVPQPLPLITDNYASSIHQWPIKHERKVINHQRPYLSLAMLNQKTKKMVKEEMRKNNMANSYVHAILRGLLMILPDSLSQPLRNMWNHVK